MAETTQEERDKFIDKAETAMLHRLARPEFEDYFRRLTKDANRLAAIERQVLWRTEDMPTEAFRWVKVDTGTFYDCLHECEPEKAVYEWELAPDYRPDETSPLFLLIID